MSYLRFEKALMTNLQESLPREVLRTNRSGAYACSTIVDCNTRKYHGLLVVPIPELDDDNHVLLSSFDPSVIQHGVEFQLGLHKYKGEAFSPNGHKYIREFDCEKVPTTLYRVGGVKLRKELVFQHYDDRVLIRYTLVDAHSETKLRFRPFLAFRSVKQFTHENPTASREYEEIENGIRTRMYAGYPYLYMQFSKKPTFVFHPDWYRDLEYPKEQERGYASREDLYVPGYFELPIKKGESIIFAASTSKSNTATLAPIFEEEREKRIPRDNFVHCLYNAAHQFLNRSKEGENYILAGYPWFKCRGRDTFIALPGLTLPGGERGRFEEVMETAAKGLRQLMTGQPMTVSICEMEKPDVGLWAVWTIQQYAKAVGRERAHKLYGSLAGELVDFVIRGGHPNLRLDDNGLLYAEGREEPITWMNSTANGQPVVPRTGYIVEINALWYNALRFVASMKREFGDAGEADRLDQLAERTKGAFVETFLNEYGYLYDYVDGAMADWSVRPNMIFAAAFDFSPLDERQKKGIVDICTRELLTPKGLRTLSPKSGGYNPMYVGPQTQRDYAYHQGTAWPWLAGFYIEACLKLYKRSRISFVERQMAGYEDQVLQHCVGTLPELFDGNPPFKGRGGISFAMNVGEVLRANELLEKYKYAK